MAHGNNCVRFVIRLAHALIAAGTPGLFENPWPAWSWRLPPMVELMRARSVRLTRTDFCCYGTPWKKSIGFLSVLVDTAPFDKQCRQRAICEFTGKPHFSLTGQRADGVFWTHVAEPYPKKLCSDLVLACRNSVLAVSAERLDKVFCKLC